MQIMINMCSNNEFQALNQIGSDSLSTWTRDDLEFGRTFVANFRGTEGFVAISSDAGSSCEFEDISSDAGSSRRGFLKHSSISSRLSFTPSIIFTSFMCSSCMNTESPVNKIIISLNYSNYNYKKFNVLQMNTYHFHFSSRYQ